jgi:hypothetical protein
LLFLASAACVNTDVSAGISALEYCRSKAQLDCDVYWNCYSLSERTDVINKRGDVGVDEASCVALLSNACTTMPFSCTVNQVFQEMKAAACITAFNDLSCDAWQDVTMPPQPRACATLCLDRVD